MTETINRRILLARRPEGEIADGDLNLVTGPVPKPSAGEALVRTLYLSIDPYMRGRMNAARSYAPPVDVGEVMTGGAVSEVVDSRVSSFKAGDVVFGYTGWQDYAAAKAGALRKLDPKVAPVTTALGVLGMPGMTAWVGMREIGKPGKGETVVVSAASGAVGAVVGQLAKIAGCRVVGIAGSAEKCAYLTGELGFAAAVNRREAGLTEALAQACPDGVDVYWDNVGGAILATIVPLMNDFGRLPLCGQISHYADPGPHPGPDRLPQVMGLVLRRRLTVRGFIVFDFAGEEGAFLKSMGALVGDGRIKYREDIVDGLENAPGALIGLLEGKNFGKLVVRVGPEPAA